MSTFHSEENSEFAELLSNFERKQEGGTIISVGSEAIVVDIGRKIEGTLSLTKWKESRGGEPAVGQTIGVSVGPRTEEGYYELSIRKVERPKDWSGLEAAFAAKRTITGMVAEQVKGGFRVDIGVRAFLPASRSGIRDAAEMPKLVGQEIECRITKLDSEKEDVVVDRRIVLEEEQGARRERAFAELREGDMVRGTVRSVMDFGAFIELLPGVDGLLHVVDMSYARVGKASDVAKVGDEIEAKILKIDPVSKKISLGLKQLQEDPWSVAARTFNVGDRVSGTISRLADFGAFVELMPGVEGLIHISELSWDKRVRKPGDLLKAGERVEAVILQVSPVERRIGLGYKQALGDPWETISEKYPIGAVVEGPITNVTQFGAFALGEGIEGMIHISDITGEKRLDHPREKLAKGQNVKAVVLEIDRERRRLRLGMKQLEPTTVDHYISEHQAGETVSGRLIEVSGDSAKVELGEGVMALCQMKKGMETSAQSAAAAPADVSSLGAMLSARWKKGGPAGEGKEAARAGEVRSFRIARLDSAKRLIELELAS